MKVNSNVKVITCDDSCLYGVIKEEDIFSVIRIDMNGNITNLFDLEYVNNYERLGLSIWGSCIYFYDMYSNYIKTVNLQTGSVSIIK